MSRILRAMTQEDWAEVLEIFYQGIQSNMATFEIDCQSFEIWDTQHLSFGRLVVEEEAEVIGWAALKPFSGRECYKGVAELSVYVDNDHKGMGVGRALLEELIAQTVDMGLWSLQASIFEENIASIKLHESCGFRRIGVRERLAKDRFGTWRSVVLMEYRIQTDKAGGCDCELIRTGKAELGSVFNP